MSRAPVRRRRVTRVDLLPWLSTLVRLGLGGVFVVAGAIKVLDLEASVQAVAAYELLPPALDRVVGWGLPFVELVLGLALIAGLCSRIAAVTAAGLLVVSVVVVVSAAARGLSIDCGCFGGGGPVVAGETDYPREIARDLVLLAAAAWLIWKPRSRLGLGPEFAPESAAPSRTAQPQ